MPNSTVFRSGLHRASGGKPKNMALLECSTNVLRTSHRRTSVSSAVLSVRSHRHRFLGAFRQTRREHRARVVDSGGERIISEWGGGERGGAKAAGVYWV